MSVCKGCLHYEVCKHYVTYEKDTILSCNQFKPKADYVEVVRCKDCVSLKNDTDYCRTHNKWYCEIDNAIKQQNHFCSYGERKESEVQGE